MFLDATDTLIVANIYFVLERQYLYISDIINKEWSSLSC